MAFINETGTYANLPDAGTAGAGYSTEPPTPSRPLSLTALTG